MPELSSEAGDVRAASELFARPDVLAHPACRVGRGVGGLRSMRGAAAFVGDSIEVIGGPLLEKDEEA
jgi:hypothetical protein